MDEGSKSESVGQSGGEVGAAKKDEFGIACCVCFFRSFRYLQGCLVFRIAVVSRRAIFKVCFSF